MFRSFVSVSAVLLFLALAAPATADPALAEKITKFAQDRLGHKVDDFHEGEAKDYSCANFVGSALRFAKAKNTNDFPGYNEGAGPDYQWGDLVVGFVLGKKVPNFKDVQPGDVIQLRNVKFTLTIEKKTATVPFSEYHTAIVEMRLGANKFQVLEQNMTTIDGKNTERKFVTRDIYDLSTLTAKDGATDGGLWVYRPVAAK